MINSFGHQVRTAASWKDQLTEIREAKKIYRENAGIMTPFEQQVITRHIGQMQQSYFPTIVGGIIREQEYLISRATEAHQRIDQAKRSEVNRWQLNKIRENTDYLKSRVDALLGASRNPFAPGSSASEELGKIYQEAQTSGDIHLQRAACEVFSGLPQTNRSLTDLRLQAERDLPALRETEEIKAAQVEAAQMWERLADKQAEIGEVAEVLGEPVGTFFASGPLAAAYKRVVVDRETGERKILSPDDPRITGVDMSKLNSMQQ